MPDIELPDADLKNSEEGIQTEYTTIAGKA